MIHSARISLVIVLMAGLVAACASPALIATPTLVPTATTAPTATPAPTLQPSDSERKVMVNEVERSYLLHIPPGLDSLHPVPVVVAFHSSSATPEDMILATGFNDIADHSGFLVVYPNGMGAWNAGGGCCGNAFTENIDEAAFVREILLDLKSTVSIDAKRIYATGGGHNAGALVYRLACEMSDTFAAIAPVAGTQLYNPCQLQQPVSLIHVHGLVDTTVPFVGGGEFNGPPIEQVVSTWAKLNRCDTSPQVERQNNIVTHTVYSSCNAGTSVELYTIETGGHIWPSKYVWPATERIWEFFAAHPKP